ncbi:MAG: serine/threonine protein kinase, partial [Anaerolineae bacterium]|nr:serine/threonine protein kinase [Anaerolineae bacterium]
MTNLSGRRLGQYTIVDVIGTGGMAMVYRARQENMRRDVAIKIIQSSLAQNADFIRRFEREAQTIASLSSPHILKVFDYGQQEDAIYIVMELLTGGNLADEIRREPMQFERIAELLSQISLALDYAHSRGIIHRDLKPQNVLLDEQGNGILTDFGIAKLMQDGGDTRLTQTGVAMGTPTYMSPEQWQGQPLDARSDLYSLGTMLYEMVTGRVPFNSPTPANLMYQHLTANPPSPQTLRSDVPPAIEMVLNRALAKQKDDRYQSAREMAREFIAALGPSLAGSAAAYEITSKGSKPNTPPGNRISGPVDVDAPTAPGFSVEADSSQSRRSGGVPPVSRGVPPPAPASGPVDVATQSQRKFPLIPVIGILLVLLIGGGGAAFLLARQNTTETPTAVVNVNTPTPTTEAPTMTPNVAPSQTPNEASTSDTTPVLSARELTRTAIVELNNTMATGVAAQETDFAVQDTQTWVAEASMTKTPTPTDTPTFTFTPTETPTATSTDTEAPPTPIPPTDVPPTEATVEVAQVPTDTPTPIPPTDVPPTERPTEVPPTAVPPTLTSTPTQVKPSATPTVCAPLPQASLLIEPLQATTYELSVQFFVTTSTGVLFDTVSVTGSSGQFTFQPDQAIVVPLVPDRLNNFVIIAQIATTTIDGCTYPGYPISAITDRNGGSLQVIQQPTPTPTPVASDTPTDTPTATDTLTFTPTDTFTPTFTFTPTATFTYTPSRTPLPTKTPVPTIDRTATRQARDRIATSTAAAAT